MGTWGIGRVIKKAIQLYEKQIEAEAQKILEASKGDIADAIAKNDTAKLAEIFDKIGGASSSNKYTKHQKDVKLTKWEEQIFKDLAEKEARKSQMPGHRLPKSKGKECQDMGNPQSFLW